MRQAGLRAVQKQRRVRTTDSRHSDPVAPNLLQRDFTAPAPNRKWLTDITAVWTAEGWVYVAVVLDVYSRLIVGGPWPGIERRAWWKRRCGWPWADANRVRSCCTIPIAGESHTSLAYQTVLA